MKVMKQRNLGQISAEWDTAALTNVLRSRRIYNYDKLNSYHRKPLSIQTFARHDITSLEFNRKGPLTLRWLNLNILKNSVLIFKVLQTSSSIIDPLTDLRNVPQSNEDPSFCMGMSSLWHGLRVPSTKPSMKPSRDHNWHRLDLVPRGAFIRTHVTAFCSRFCSHC